MKSILFTLAQIYKGGLIEIHGLEGTFSSGIEGALASTLNRDFNWK